MIGAGGAGKTTVARELGRRTGLPVIHLDTLYWRPGWQPTPADEWRATVRQLLARPRWIIDGNYGGTLDLRLEASDTVVFLDLPRRICLWRVLRRWARHLGRARPEMAPGCPEHLTGEFLGWIWTYRSRRRPDLLRRLAALKHAQQVVVLDSARAVTRFLAEVQLSPWCPAAGSEGSEKI